MTKLVEMKEYLYEFITDTLYVFDVCILGHTAHFQAVV
jgi:hypothetical protein